MNNRKAKAIKRLVQAHSGISDDMKKTAARILRKAYNRHQIDPVLEAGIKTYQPQLSLKERIRVERQIEDNAPKVSTGVV
jgi:hypothetical protein